MHISNNRTAGMIENVQLHYGVRCRGNPAILWDTDGITTALLVLCCQQFKVKTKKEIVIKLPHINQYDNVQYRSLILKQNATYDSITVVCTCGLTLAMPCTFAQFSSRCLCNSRSLKQISLSCTQKQLYAAKCEKKSLHGSNFSVQWASNVLYTPTVWQKLYVKT